jgi:hypothetical protein
MPSGPVREDTLGVRCSHVRARTRVTFDDPALVAYVSLAR